MPVSGVSSSNPSISIVPGFQQMQKIKQEFQQLGQDLQSGNLSAARSDSTALDQLWPQYTSPSCAQSNSPIGQDLSQLSQDLQAGNLSTAQQEYSTLQNDFQAAGMMGPYRQPNGGSVEGLLNRLFNQIGTDLHSWGLLSHAQIYNCIQQGTQQFHQTAGQNSAQNSSQAGSKNLSVLA